MKKIFPTISLGLVLACGSGLPARSEIQTEPSGLGSIRAYPNPWRADQNGQRLVTFDGFPASSVVVIKIFTIAAELVRTLSGTQSIQWDLKNSSGERVASGVYIYLAIANGEQHSGKIAVIR